MGRRISRPLAGLLAAAAVLLVAAGAGAATKSVTLSDLGGPHFEPGSKTIHKGDKIKWVWGDAAVEQHDVILKRAPDGVKKGPFREQSHTGAGFTETSPAFKVKGDYKFLCSLHPQAMKFRLTVRK